MQVLDLGVLEAKLGRLDRNLGVREHADMQTACHQNLYLFQLLKVHS